MNGPVQVLVIGFDRPTFSGGVLFELGRLKDAGIVRLLDLMLVSRGGDGTLQTLPVSDDAAPNRGELAAALLARAEGEEPGPTAETGPRTADSSWSLADAIPEGGTAAVALLEHNWAAPLMEAVEKAGGVPLEETWL